LRERKIGTPGNHVNVDVTRKYSLPTRQTLGSGWNPGMTGFVKLTRSPGGKAQTAA
jgi:hypothetical protein